MCTFHFVRPSLLRRFSTCCRRLPGGSFSVPVRHPLADGREQLAPKHRHAPPASAAETRACTATHWPDAAQAPAGHQTVNVWMQHQRLAPGVQRGDDAGPRPQIFRIAQQLQQRVVHTGKQQPGHPVDVGPPQLIQLVGHGEDDMIMLAGQQPSLLRGEPAFDLHPGTLRTHPMPTGVVPDPFEMPLRTGLDVSTQQRGATRQDRPHRPTHIVRQRVRARIGRIAQL